MIVIGDGKAMLIKVKRKSGAPRIASFSQADMPSLVLDQNIDEFDIPIEFLCELGEYFEPCFPVNKQEKAVETFMFAKNPGGKN